MGHGGNSKADKQHYHEGDDERTFHFATSADDDIFITDDFVKNHGKNGGLGAHLGGDQGASGVDEDDVAAEKEDDFFGDDGIVTVESDDDELADLTGPSSRRKLTSASPQISWDQVVKDSATEKPTRYDHSDYTALFEIKRHDLSTGVGLAEVVFQVGLGEDVDLGEWYGW